MSPGSRRNFILESSLVETLIFRLLHILWLPHPERRTIIDSLPLSSHYIDHDRNDRFGILDLDLVVVVLFGFRCRCGRESFFGRGFGPEEDGGSTIFGVFGNEFS